MFNVYRHLMKFILQKIIPPTFTMIQSELRMDDIETESASTLRIIVIGHIHAQMDGTNNVC